MKILVVDDEQDICEILQFNLEKEGYEVVTAQSAEEALNIISRAGTKLPDLILLDVMMGGMSGFQMAEELKSKDSTKNIPIVFTTALDDEDSTVKGLDLGADDYIAKPLSMKEVKARVRAVMRRQTHITTSAADESTVCYEDLSLDLNSKRAKLGEEDIALTKLEFEILLLMLQNPNKVFSREDLLTRCWPNDVMVLDRTVDVNITRLRKKIGRLGKQIKTRVGYGYSFEE